MSVRKRKDPRYRKQFVATVDRGRDLEGNRLREEKSFERRKDALDWEREEYAAARSRKRMRSQLPTLGALLADWIDQGEHLHDWSPRHLANSRRLIAGPLARLHPVRIDRLETAQLEALFTKLIREGSSPHSVRHVRNVLRSALQLATRRQLITTNVAALSTIPATPRKPPVALDEHQIPRFLEASAGDRLAQYWLTAMLLALRPGEVTGLRWSDVDFDRHQVTIARGIQYSDGAYHVRETKTRQVRTIPLPAVAERALRSQRMNQLWEQGEASTWTDQDLVFTNREGGPVHPPYARRRLQAVLERAGLPRLTLYQLRHTGATLLLHLGVPIEQIREIMGHSTIQMTLGYARVSEELQRQAMDRLDAFLETGAPDG